MSLTVAVISKSKEISKWTLQSISFADEIIIVVDSPSRHCEEVHRRGNLTPPVKYYFRPLKGDFSAQRNFAISKAESDWILFVDDDEYVSTELAAEIKEHIKTKSVIGYFIPRKDVVFHDVLNHGETGKIKILRLAQKNAGKFSRSVHEKWNTSGLVKDLHSPLYHIKDHFVSEFMSRMAMYGPADAKELEMENKPFSYFRFFVYPKAKFIQNYYFRLGILDGTPGLFLAYLLAIQSLSVRIFQWTKES